MGTDADADTDTDTVTNTNADADADTDIDAVWRVSVEHLRMETNQDSRCRCR